MKKEELNWEKIINDLTRVTNKKDFIVNKENLGYSNEGNIVALTNDFNQIDYNPTPLALNQLMTKAGMPTTYFSKLSNYGQHELIKRHVHYNMNNSKDKEIMVRVADINGQRKARAILSDKYSPIENDEIVKMLRENISDDYHIGEYSYDLNTMMIRLVSRDIEKQVEVSKGDNLATGIIVMNSETGTSGVRIAPTVLRLICSNGMTAWQTLGDKSKFYKRHVGLSPEEMYGFVASAINLAQEEAMAQAKKLKITQGIEVEDGQQKIKEILSSSNITKAFVEKVENIWMSEWGSEGTMYAVINSITRSARDINSQDRIMIEGVVGDYLNGMNLAA